MSVQFFVDIDKILKRKNMTLTQLADLTGIHVSHLSKIRHKRKVTFDTLNKIASALGETDLDGLVSAEFESVGKIIR